MKKNNSKVALVVRIEAKPGHEAEVKEMLEKGVAYVNEEAGTEYWFGLQINERTFGIFDTFPGDDERRAHLEGKLAAALLERAPVVLAVPPVIEQATILASKC